MPKLVEKECVLSIDTYRPETFCYISELMNRQETKVPLVWNDVSGVFDNSVCELLSGDPNTYYVFSHTRVPSRDRTSFHMDYVRDSENIFDEVVGHFREGLEKISPQDRKRVILDPCFGFSKSHEQNLSLMKSMKHLVSLFPENYWMIGISRKSFLQRLVRERVGRPPKLEELEKLQSEWLERWQSELSGQQIIVRLHDPSVMPPNFA